MPSITKKKIRGRTYYYARECQRINGKPKIVWQKYLGKAEDIVAAMTGGAREAQPERAVVTEFGAVTALFDLAQRLRFVEHVDRHVPKKGAGPSVGTYLLVAALNRCVSPCSKASTGDWFERTALRRLLPVEARQLTSQRFWDNMDRVPREALAKIEEDLTRQLVREFDLDLRRLLFDATNFFTFVDSFNDRCSIAQRGKSKEGRAALRIVGLALLVTADGHVPLLHRTYPGNQPDSPTFASLTGELVERYRALTDGAEHVTLVFDKGNNSKGNLRDVDESPFHFVGSLVPGHHAELLAIPREHFEPVSDDLPGVEAYRCSKEVFGAERTVVVTCNENLFVTQCQTLLREIGKRRKLLRQEQLRLRKWRSGKIRNNGKRPTVASVEKKVGRWLSARHMKDLLNVDVVEADDGLPALTYRLDQRAWKKLQSTLLGKTILFTDNGDWSNAEIVQAYRGQHAVEEAFRTLKDPHHVSLRPQYHWTDQKIEVHVFCCVVGLMLCTLLRRELLQQGIDRSIPNILNDLGRIQEVAVLYPPESEGADPSVRVTLSELSPEQQALFEALGLQRYVAA